MGNALDKTRPRTFVYKKDESGTVINKIVYQEDYEEAEKDGWTDSMITLVNLKETDIDASDKGMVQLVGESVQGVSDSINGGLNLDLMKPVELAEYAERHFNVKIRYIGVKKDKILNEVKALLED